MVSAAMVIPVQPAMAMAGRWRRPTAWPTRTAVAVAKPSAVMNTSEIRLWAI